jgi:hypothetical protein
VAERVRLEAEQKVQVKVKVKGQNVCGLRFDA